MIDSGEKVEDCGWKTADYAYKNAPIGLCCFDLDLRYVRINEWLAAINGLSIEQHLGKKIKEALPNVSTGIVWQLHQVIDTGEPVLHGLAEVEIKTEPGRKKLLEHSYYPIKSDDGKVVGVSCVVQDVTDRDYFRKVQKKEDKMLAIDSLTNREMDVLGLSVKRLRGKQIADKLSISPQTVKTHLRHIYRKLGVNNSRNAAAKLRELGILDDELS